MWSSRCQGNRLSAFSNSLRQPRQVHVWPIRRINREELVKKITACPLQLSPQTHTILPTMRITSSLRQLSSITPRFNKAITEDSKEKLQVLLKNGWNLSKNGIGIEKAYEFRGFSRAMKFIRFVADEAKDKKHHPEWANVRFT